MRVEQFEACLASGKQLEVLANTLTFHHPQDRKKVNPKLLADLACAAKVLGFYKITIGSAITGRRKFTAYGTVSRHFKGNAVDISHINGVGVKDPAGRNFANKLVSLLLSKGYSFNVESGQAKSVLWQSPGHYDHIHVSRID